jgi:tetratricopeptide (TPR) repeat protein
VEGASNNGMSNTFPRVTPDGKWIVYTKCKNGMLMRPDGRLWIVPVEGGEAREMRCNTWRMNSWHSFSPNGRWMVFSSKANTPYTQLFLTHIDEDGNDTPAILVPNSTASNRAANIPEFVNRSYDSFRAIDIPAADHHRLLHDGMALAREGKFEEAARLFRKALDNEPEFTRALGHYGRALLELGRIEEARKYLRRALELDPHFAFVHVILGVTYLREGDPETAERCFMDALEFDTKEYMAYYNLAVIRLEQGRLDEAMKLSRRSSELDPCDANTHNLYGWTLVKAGRLDEAAEAFREALVHQADHRLARENLIAILRKQGPASELIEQLRAVVKSRPEEVGAALSLAWELATQKDAADRDGAEAVRLAEACRKKTGDRADVLDVLAAAYAEAGRFEDAVNTAGRAVELSKAGQGAADRGVTDRLASYRRGEPFRQP